MTLIEAAAQLGLAPATLRHEIANGKLRATKRGRGWWVTAAEIRRYQRNRGTHKAYDEGLRERRFWERIDKRPDGCWQWLGPVDNRGYGRISRIRTHRYAYELLVGPIPEGLQIDHLCRNRLCANPDHLESVTGSENIKRGYASRLTAR